MAAREKPKRKALHRGLDDIINRDASLTSRLLGRVKPPSREPLDVPSVEDDTQTTTAAPPNTDDSPSTGPERKREAAHLKQRPQKETASVYRLEPSRTEKRTRTPKDSEDVQSKRASSLKAEPPRTGSDIGNTSGEAPRPIHTNTATFEDFVAQWGFILRSGGRTGKLRICEVLYKNTYAVGSETFFTSYEKLAKLTDLEKKQCAINVRQLESLGFVERVSIFNTATRQGTEFKLHLDQLSPDARKSPQYYHYDEQTP